MSPTRETSEIVAGTSKYLRSDPARGLRAGKPELARVDQAGGDHGQGIIRGASIITTGEALGHGAWIDQEFSADVASAINERPAGIKARFTHPSLSGDGLGSFLGRAKNAVEVDGQVFADIHFSPSGHTAPDGDLASYVMDLADDAPDEFGVSIVFMSDIGAEDRHQADHMDEGGTFRSPDPANIDNLPHVRLAVLRAADVVDEPAANPGGLFHRGQQIAQDADGLLAYALGLTDTAPTATALDVDPDRARQFVARFLLSHGLTLEPQTMSEDQKPADDADETVDSLATENKPDDNAASETATASTDQGASLSSTDPPAKTGADFMAAFGEKNGALFFTKGLSFEAAQEAHTLLLAEENARLKNQLAASQAAGGAGETAPVDFASDEPADKKVGLAGLIRIAGR